MDLPFLCITALLIVVGILIFSSASLSLLARGGAPFGSVAFSQFVLGVGGGMLALVLFSFIPYRSYRPMAPYAFLGALLLTSLVFVDSVGVELHGARRWLDVFGLSFQPAETLKLGFILCIAWYYSSFHDKLDSFKVSVAGFVVALGLSGLVLLQQPDTGTFTILAATGCAMALAAGLKARHLALIGTVLFCGLIALAFMRPYLLERVTTFMDPVDDPRGAGYQIRQSLIAIGSGGVLGRGFGQSVQKFHYLPEANGDSIFSVAAEEFGFVGSTLLILLFVSFAVRGLQIASRAPDRFGGLLVVGIVILIVTQSFINMASMMGLIPLTGEPLVFISHGGTALMLALAGVGMVLNVSRYSKPKKLL
jgi:cell division protein FtsW